MQMNEVLAAIATMNLEETQEVYEAIKARRERIRVMQTRVLRIGQNVRFQARGADYVGYIQKINMKTVTVKTNTGIWRVSPELLEAV